jgi:flagellar motor switch protein FliG
MLLYEVNINVLKDIPNEILKKYAKVKNVLLNDNSNLENINYKTFKEVVEYISYFRKAEIDFKGINNFIEKVAESNPLVIEKVLKHAKVFDSLEKILDYPQFVEVFDRIPDEII